MNLKEMTMTIMLIVGVIWANNSLIKVSDVEKSRLEFQQKLAAMDYHTVKYQQRGITKNY